jgi:Flp pilus assembly protein TadD
MQMKDFEQQFELGKSLLRSGNILKAYEIFNKLLTIKSNDPYVLSERGVAYFHMKKNDLALADLNQAVDLQPNNPYRYSSRAFIKSAMGDVQGGIEDYKKAIELDPNDAIAYNNLGLLLEKSGYEKSAKKKYEIADLLAKEDNDILYNETTFTKIESKSVEIENSDSSSSFWHLFLKIFSSKKVFKEYLRFIRSGFKLNS